MVQAIMGREGWGVRNSWKELSNCVFYYIDRLKEGGVKGDNNLYILVIAL